MHIRSYVASSLLKKFFPHSNMSKYLGSLTTGSYVIVGYITDLNNRNGAPLSSEKIQDKILRVIIEEEAEDHNVTVDKVSDALTHSLCLFLCLCFYGHILIRFTT